MTIEIRLAVFPTRRVIPRTIERKSFPKELPPLHLISKSLHCQPYCRPVLVPSRLASDIASTGLAVVASKSEGRFPLLLGFPKSLSIPPAIVARL